VAYKKSYLLLLLNFEIPITRTTYIAKFISHERYPLPLFIIPRTLKEKILINTNLHQIYIDPYPQRKIYLFCTCAGCAGMVKITYAELYSQHNHSAIIALAKTLFKRFPQVLLVELVCIVKGGPSFGNSKVEVEVEVGDRYGRTESNAGC
jgi:hypothetical protein